MIGVISSLLFSFCVCVCACVRVWSSVVRLHAYTLASQHILYAACLRLPSHFSKSFTVIYVDYMLHRIAYTVMMNCKGSWRARSWCNRAISRNLSGRTRKNLDNQESLCTCWYSNHDIFEERSRSNTSSFKLQPCWYSMLYSLHGWNGVLK
jgi:hypothetical protein